MGAGLRGRRNLTRALNASASSLTFPAPLACFFVNGWGDSLISHRFQVHDPRLFLRAFLEDDCIQDLIGAATAEQEVEQEATQCPRTGFILLVNKVKDYVHRGGQLAELPAILITMFFEKVKIRSAPGTHKTYAVREEEQLEDAEEPPSKKPARGRPRHQQYPFTADHPQYHTHVLRRRGTSVLPRFISDAPLQPAMDCEDDEAKRIYAAFVLANFVPHRRKESLAAPADSLWEPYEQWREAPACTKLGQRLLKMLENIQSYVAARHRRRRSAKARRSMMDGCEKAVASSNTQSDSDSEASDAEARPPWEEDEEEAAATSAKGRSHFDVELDMLLQRPHGHGEKAYICNSLMPFQAASFVQGSRAAVCGLFPGQDLEHWRKETDKQLRRLSMPPASQAPLSTDEEAQVQPSFSVLSAQEHLQLQLGTPESREYKLWPRVPTIEEAASTFTLSRDQMAPFSLLASSLDRQLSGDKVEQCLSVISGEPGCGKSHIIQAFLWYAYQLKATSRLAVTSFQ
jgi:hypothetical protein